MVASIVSLIFYQRESTRIDSQPNPSHAKRAILPTDKKPGVRPVGIGKVLRRIVGKAVMSVLQRDMVSATAPVQVCASLPGGVR